MNRIAILIDKSGSMAPLTADTIGGFNTWLDTLQNGADHHASVNLTMFDTETHVILRGVELSAVKPLTSEDYIPAGGTALNDALGDTLTYMKRTAKKDDRVLFLIITDGEENSSRKVQKAALLSTIKAQTEKGWEFQYIGANVDAFAETAKYGFTGSTQYYSTRGSTQVMYNSLGTATAGWAGGQSLSSSMPTNIDAEGNVTPPVTTKP